MQGYRGACGAYRTHRTRETGCRRERSDDDGSLSPASALTTTARIRRDSRARECGTDGLLTLFAPSRKATYQWALPLLPIRPSQSGM